MKISDWKIGVRLGVGFGAVLLTTILMTVIGLLRVNQMDGLGDETFALGYKSRIATEHATLTAQSARIFNAYIVSVSPEVQKLLQAQIEDNSKRINELLHTLNEQTTSESGKERLAKITELRKQYVGTRTKAIDLKRKGDDAQAREVLDKEVMPAEEAYIRDLKAYADTASSLSEKANNVAGDAASFARKTLIVLGIVSILLCGVIGWLLTRSIVLPVKAMVEVARKMAKGDLTATVTHIGGGELRELLMELRDMRNGWAKIVGNIRQGSDTIATASSQIAAGNLDLSARTEEQASSLEETASSMEELTSTVKQNADNAHQANQLAATASGVAVKGGNVVSQVVTTMESINDSSRKIVDIISVIDGIAFQTNILALNAAVEAARAGEQGRGFAVVAAEVRTLAQRSATAAKEIKELIDDSVSKVDAGSKLVHEAGETMQEIVSSVQRVTDIMSEITAASAEQSTGIEQVNEAIMQMDQVTQQNASLVEEAAAAAESLQDQAKNLVQAVSIFTVDPSQLDGVAPAARQQRKMEKPVETPRNLPTPARVATRTLATPEPKRIAGTRPSATDDWEEF